MNLHATRKGIMPKEPLGLIPMPYRHLDGNAFGIMGQFSKSARQCGWSPDEIKAVLDEAKSGNYRHLLLVISKHLYGGEDFYNHFECQGS